MGRARLLGAVGLLLALIPSGGATIYQARAASGIGIAQSDFAAATPANAVLFTAIQATAADQNTNLSSLEHTVLGKVHLDTLVEYQAGPGPSGMITQLATGLRGVFNGEATVSMLPVTTATTAPGKVLPQFHILVEGGLKPGIGAAVVQGALMLQGLSSTTTSTHDGITVTSLNLASLLRSAGAGAGMPASEMARLDAVTLQVAVVKNIGIVASDVSTINAAIDAATGNAPTLAANPDFQGTYAALPDSRVATLYVHLDVAADRQLAAALMPGRAGSAALTGTYSQAFAVSAEAHGILETASPRIATGDLAKAPDLMPLAGTTPAILPAGTLFFATISNPGALFQYALTQAAAMRQQAGGSASGLDPLKVINRLLGLDLNQDVFSWMTGEASIALLPTGSPAAKTAAGKRLSLVLTLKVDNQALVDGKLHQILGALASLSDDPTALQLVHTTGAGGVVQQVASATPEGIGYAFVNGYLVVATALPADVAALQAANPSANLAADPQFQAAIQAAGGTGAGAVAYANLSALRQTFEQLAVDGGMNITRYDTTIKPVLSLFTSLTVVTRAGTAGGGALFLGIAN